jgi:hypothetical protein
MKGYKVFNPDWTCNGFKYEVGKVFEMNKPPVICRQGFHFCKKATDCFEYYEFDPNNKVAEVEALGDVETEGNKSCTNKIHIIRELSWYEVLDLVNTGAGNTGRNNSGNMNSGNRNSGNMNSGDRNSGNRNSGNRNSGYRNSGDRNSGDMNSGNMNSGDMNSGNMNSGDMNSGNRNSGNRNSGNRNSGYRNSGNMNSGDMNSGNRNSGYRNSGNRNSGDMNSGDMNSGDWNLSNNNSGCFNTERHPLYFFDNPTDMTFKEWRNSEAYYLLIGIDFMEWVYFEDMTEEEKKKHPEAETTGGYLKQYDLKESANEWWSELDDYEKEVIKNIPNFDAEKFYKITGVKVE